MISSPSLYTHHLRVSGIVTEQLELNEHAGGAQGGIGRRTQENNWRRGRFVVNQVQAINLLSGEEKLVQSSGSNRVTVPDLPTTWADAEALAARLSPNEVTLRFLSPLRLTENK